MKDVDTSGAVDEIASWGTVEVDYYGALNWHLVHTRNEWAAYHDLYQVHRTNLSSGASAARIWTAPDSHAWNALKTAWFESAWTTDYPTADTLSVSDTTPTVGDTITCSLSGPSADRIYTDIRLYRLQGGTEDEEPSESETVVTGDVGGQFHCEADYRATSGHFVSLKTPLTSPVMGR